MHSYEQKLFNKTKNLIREKIKKLCKFENYVIDYSFYNALNVLEKFEEDLKDNFVFKLNKNFINFDHFEIIMHDILDEYKACLENCHNLTTDQEAFDELNGLIDDSKVLVKNYYINFKTYINNITRDFCVISNISNIQNRLKILHYNYEKVIKNLQNLQFLITVDNAKQILIKNFEKLYSSISNHYQNSFNLIENIIMSSNNPCMKGFDSSECPDYISSSDEEDLESVTSEKSKKIPEVLEKTSECFQLPVPEHTKVDSIENLQTNAEELKQQIATIEEEINRVNQTIDEKKLRILDAILKVVNLEEVIEEIEISIADELYQFQTKVIATEMKLLENFKGENNDELKKVIENQLMQIKIDHNEKVKNDDKNYSKLSKEAKIFASSIGNIVDEYKKLDNETNEKYHYNIEKLNLLLSRPAEFCNDSKGERFFYNQNMEKIFQVEAHRSQYAIDNEGNKVKINEGKPLETVDNREFYIDIKGRKIYTKYFFEDEFGLYYIDINGFRHYQTDPRASEYALVNGNWVKIKEGTYERDEKGLRIPDKVESQTDEDEGEELVSDLLTGQSKAKSKISNEEFKYLQEVVGPVIIKACTACYLHQPADPVNYFANFLKHYEYTQRIFKIREKELQFFIELRKQMKEGN
ncbi:hypothetical protein PVAND_001302 [Polypedilum vanderplanki]|uniref:Uncharacterized protein n=1 Tax=Polypedilum vanderplanki TaxID=319348 RepID=A0A9J6BMZ0_POLVA|nr:hypothetical protein PVAND_001302 [Polypedilum vanderplanki]